MAHSHAIKLLSAITTAAKGLEARNMAKARVIHQLHRVKEMAKSLNPNRRFIDKEFDELHVKIVDLIRHEKGLLKRQEEDEHLFQSLKTHIEHLEERLKKSEELLKHSFHNTKKIDEIDTALHSLYKNVVREFDIKGVIPSAEFSVSVGQKGKPHTKKTSRKGKSKGKAAKVAKKDFKLEKLKKLMTVLEEQYKKLKNTEKDTEKLELIRAKIELLKEKLG